MQVTNADYNLPLLQMSPCFHSFFKSIIHHYSKIFFCLSKSFYFFFQKNCIGKSFERLGNKRRGVTCMTSTRTNNVDILYSGSRHGIIYARSFVSVRDNSIEFFFIKLPACSYNKHLRLHKGHKFLSFHVSSRCDSWFDTLFLLFYQW